MDKSKIGAKGGIRSAANKRCRGLHNYYSEPNYCNYCGHLIEVEKGKSIRDARKKKFCDTVCRESYQNGGVTKRGPENPEQPTRTKSSLGRKRINGSTKEAWGYCLNCKEKVDYCPNKSKPGFYSKRHYCDKCLKIIRSDAAKKRNGKNTLPKPVTEYTKGELLNLKGYTCYKRLIVKHATRIFDESKQDKKCHVCDYSLVDICHIHDVANFSEDTLISEINSLENLVTLCPTHHREFDKNLFCLLR